MEDMAISTIIYWIKKLEDTCYVFSRHNETLVPPILSFSSLDYTISNHNKNMRKDLLEQYEKDLIHEISLTSDGTKSTASEVLYNLHTAQGLLGR